MRGSHFGTSDDSPLRSLKRTVTSENTNTIQAMTAPRIVSRMSVFIFKIEKSQSEIGFAILAK